MDDGADEIDRLRTALHQIKHICSIKMLGTMDNHQARKEAHEMAIAALSRQ
jgi:hypothetical protein